MSMTIAYNKFFNDKKTSELMRAEIEKRNRKAAEKSAIGDSLMKEGRYRKALEHYERADKISTEDYPNKQDLEANLNFARTLSLNKTGEELYGLRSYRAAVKKFNSALKYCPESQTTLNKRIFTNLQNAAKRAQKEPLPRISLWHRVFPKYD